MESVTPEQKFAAAFGRALRRPQSPPPPRPAPSSPSRRLLIVEYVCSWVLFGLELGIWIGNAADYPALQSTEGSKYIQTESGLKVDSI